ncbi:hypothetical protein NM688_g3433 [Phlebia brevispora]|uniref:Uncharacterized protein n=1 Tax=Phlebia brevispora TaxID=194682 RepID=A0ACC1T5X4_9APHY|nr:hypothetical protein NM688_g3433 [Phlebia brevispora]
MKSRSHSPSIDAVTAEDPAVSSATRHAQTSPSRRSRGRKRRARREVTSQTVHSQKGPFAKSHSSVRQRQEQPENNTQLDDQGQQTQSGNTPQLDAICASVELDTQLEAFLGEGECLGGRGPPYLIEPPLFVVFSGKDPRYSDKETCTVFRTMKQVNACILGCPHYIWTEYKSVDSAWDSWEKGNLEGMLPLPIHPESLWPCVISREELERRCREYLLSRVDLSPARPPSSLDSLLERYGLEARLPLLPRPLFIQTPTVGWRS